MSQDPQTKPAPRIDEHIPSRRQIIDMLGGVIYGSSPEKLRMVILGDNPEPSPLARFYRSEPKEAPIAMLRPFDALPKSEHVIHNALMVKGMVKDMGIPVELWNDEGTRAASEVQMRTLEHVNERIIPLMISWSSHVQSALADIVRKSSTLETIPEAWRLLDKRALAEARSYRAMTAGRRRRARHHDKEAKKLNARLDRIYEKHCKQHPNLKDFNFHAQTH